MDLKCGYPYWAVKNGLMYAFPHLDADLVCDVTGHAAVANGYAAQSWLRQHVAQDAPVRPRSPIRWITAIRWAPDRAQIERRPHALTRQLSFSRMG
jgi:hypothetical protein